MLQEDVNGNTQIPLLVNQFAKDLEGVEVTVDDFLIRSRAMEEHNDRLIAFL